MPRQALAALALLAGVVFLASGCGGSASPASGSSGGRIRVVAAENFWGSIAAQLGGERVSASSIVVNPNTDPHSYEPTASDAIAIAGSQLAIVNGIGYDGWASKLLAANPSGTRVVLDVGELLGQGQGENPHQWYSPSSVRRVIGRIVADYERLDPRDALYFDRRRLRSEIRARYAGVPVGYSESVFQPLGADLGLRLLTPYSFAKAIAEGTDVSAADKQTVDRQAERHAIEVWVYNSQNATPDVQRVNQLARAARVPITTVTETLSPASATFEQWQVGELSSLLAALRRASGR
jgi:zinc/manganese transport system substrate-binding protein